MASTELTSIHAVVGLDDGGSADPNPDGPLIRRPVELVELAEVLYRGVFGFGLLVSSIATLYAIGLSALQPTGQQSLGIIVCSLLLIGQLMAARQRARLYALLRRRPGLVLLPAAAIGAGAWIIGSHNEQLFYVLTILIGVLGSTVPFRWLLRASVLAAVGMAIPHITDGSWAIGAAVAGGILPPLFWLILEQFARFMLRLHQTTVPRKGRPKRVPGWHDLPPPPDTPPASTVDMSVDSERDKNESATTSWRGGELSARQLEVLLLRAEGLKNSEIGDCLQIGSIQVGRQLKNACRNVGAGTTAELVAWGITTGVIPRAQRDRSPASGRSPQK